MEEQYLEEDITGFPTPEEKDKSDLDQCNKVLETEGHLIHLKNTPGWKILEEYLTTAIKSYTEDLKVEEDYNKIRKLQCLIVTLEFLPGVIDNVFFEASKAKEILQRFINEDLALPG